MVKGESIQDYFIRFNDAVKLVTDPSTINTSIINNRFISGLSPDYRSIIAQWNIDVALKRTDPNVQLLDLYRYITLHKANSSSTSSTSSINTISHQPQSNSTRPVFNISSNQFNRRPTSPQNFHQRNKMKKCNLCVKANMKKHYHISGRCPVIQAGLNSVLQDDNKIVANYAEKQQFR